MVADKGQSLFQFTNPHFKFKIAISNSESQFQFTNPHFKFKIKLPLDISRFKVGLEPSPNLWHQGMGLFRSWSFWQ